MKPTIEHRTLPGQASGSDASAMPARTALTIAQSIGKRVEALRSRQGWDHGQFAQRWGQALGESRSREVVGQLERNTKGRKESVLNLITLAYALNVSPAALVGDEAADPPIQVGSRLLHATTLADWMTGALPLPGQDGAFFQRNRPIRLLYLSSGRESMNVHLMHLSLEVDALQRAMSAHDKQAVNDACVAIKRVANGVQEMHGRASV